MKSEVLCGGAWLCRQDKANSVLQREEGPKMGPVVLRMKDGPKLGTVNFQQAVKVRHGRTWCFGLFLNGRN